MLSEAGRWQEAEVELRRAVEVSLNAGHRSAAMAGLAELRIHQSRTAEAAVLLRGWEDRLETAQAQARLHDARDELDLAVSVLRWALREQETNLVASASLWAHLVEVECRRNIDAADEAASRQEFEPLRGWAADECRPLAARMQCPRCRGRSASSAMANGPDCGRRSTLRSPKPSNRETWPPRRPKHAPASRSTHDTAPP